ncbi:17785_t:CDS:2, partial [Funneliformis caledonium]
GATADYLNVKVCIGNCMFGKNYNRTISKQEVQGSLRIHIILPDLAETKDKSDRGGFW